MKLAGATEAECALRLSRRNTNNTSGACLNGEDFIAYKISFGGSPWR